MAVTDDAELAGRMRRMSLHGLSVSYAVTAQLTRRRQNRPGRNLVEPPQPVSP